MLDKIKVNGLRDLALDHLPKTVALSKKLYLEHHDSRAALQVVATAPTLLINSPLSTTIEKLAGRLLHLVGEHPDTHTESLIDWSVDDKSFGITLEDAVRYAEQKRAPIEAALIKTAQSLCEISGASLPPWMNSHKEQFASAQTATPAPLAALEAQRGYELALPIGSSHVQFGELAHLIADALWPDAGADDTRMTYGSSRVNLDGELLQAVKSGTLQVKDPLTFGPHTFPVGKALLSALVTVDDLRQFVATRGLTVASAQTHTAITSPPPMADEIDFTMVASRKELIAAFGGITQMDMSWFDNLTDAPQLNAARKFKGQGGRHSAEPLFCPFKVMQWLVDPKRKKGKPINDTTAWRLLKGHFPKVYNHHSIVDPSDD